MHGRTLITIRKDRMQSYLLAYSYLRWASVCSTPPCLNGEHSLYLLRPRLIDLVVRILFPLCPGYISSGGWDRDWYALSRSLSGVYKRREPFRTRHWHECVLPRSIHRCHHWSCEYQTTTIGVVTDRQHAYQAVAGAIFSARSRGRLPEDLPMNGSGHTIDYSALINLEPKELKGLVLSIVSSSIKVCVTGHLIFRTSPNKPARSSDNLDCLRASVRNIFPRESTLSSPGLS